MSHLPSILLQVSPDDPYYGLYEFGWTAEMPIAILSAVVAAYGLSRFLPLLTHRLFVRQPNPGVGVVRVAVLFAVFWFWFVLQTGAASDILGFYTWMYVAMALATLFIGGFWRPILDLYYPGDVVERGNLAAGLVFAGFVLGTAFSFGGALTGEGPGWWVVVVFFALAYLELRANMAMVSRLAGHLKDDVRLDRDVSAGLLLGAVAMASGLVSGRAAAGDFLGWGHALTDYGQRLWPLLVVAAVGAGVGAYTRWADPERKLRVRGIASGLLVLAAFVWYFVT